MREKTYQEGYCEGYRDGFKDGANSNVPIPSSPKYPQPFTNLNQCPVCKRTFYSIDLYVCYNPECPSRITCVSTTTGN